MSVRWLLCVFTLLAASLAGCAGGPAALEGAQDQVEGNVHIHGLVVDAEFIPLPDAVVAIQPGDLVNRTATDGSFRLGPVDPGTYVVVAEKEGYLTTEVEIQATEGMDRVVIELTPTSRDVPYHEMWSRVAFIDCTMSVAGLVAPCVPIDAATGQNITGDQSTFEWEIPNPGLANMLSEMTWQEQTTGESMFIVFLDPGTTTFASGVTPFYYSQSGTPPLRGWLVPGEVGPGADTPFDGNESREYHVKIRASTEGSTVPATVFIQHRVDFWFTFFYNRPGPESFTALPDE